MGIFDKLFGSENASQEPKKLFKFGKTLTDVQQLEEAKAESNEKTVVLFKHSTRCGISRMVLREFESDYNYPEEKVQVYFLDLLNHKDVSNAIAEKFGIIHESPQFLILKEGKVVHYASHESISAKQIGDFV